MASVKKLILASQSPFRRALLTASGIDFTVAVADVDEYAITAVSPGEVSLKRAEAKALAVAAQHPGCLVIGADQVLSLGDQMFDKASERATARQRLLALSGHTHHLHSGFVLAYGRADQTPLTLTRRLVSAAMTMRPLTEGEIEAYLDTDEWRGSVGCYQYENRGVQLFTKVDADHSTIIGLPLLPLLEELRALGVNPLQQPLPPWVLVRQSVDTNR